MGRWRAAQKRVTAFGAFYDSTLDRYSDMALYMGLLVYYAVNGRTSYVILGGRRDGRFGDGQLCSRARRVPDSALQGRLHGAPRAHGAAHSRRII